MGTIPIPSIETVDPCEMGASIDISLNIATINKQSFEQRACAVYGQRVYIKDQDNLDQTKEKAECKFFSGNMFDGIGSR